MELLDVGPRHAAISYSDLTSERRHHELDCQLESEAREQSEVAERLIASLQDLVSELRLDEVLAKITANAQAAVGGQGIRPARGGGRRPTVPELHEPPARRRLGARDLDRGGAGSGAPGDDRRRHDGPELSRLASDDRIPSGRSVRHPLAFRGRHQELEELASRDHLTGLLTLREFHESLTRELERCKRHGGRFSVVLFDLNRFKAVRRIAPRTGARPV